jgi:ribosome biogenesis protein MAK21
MKASMPRAEGDDDDLLMGSDVDEDSEDEDLSLDFDDDNEDSQVDLSDDDDDEKDTSDADDALSLVEDSDNEALISLDGDIPDGLIEYDGSDASDGEVGIVVDEEEEEWGGIGSAASSKKRKREETSGAKRKKLRSLPTFASYEDYAKMIEDGPEDDI